MEQQVLLKEKLSLKKKTELKTREALIMVGHTSNPWVKMIKQMHWSVIWLNAEKLFVFAELISYLVVVRICAHHVVMRRWPVVCCFTHVLQSTIIEYERLETLIERTKARLLLLYRTRYAPSPFCLWVRSSSAWGHISRVSIFDYPIFFFFSFLLFLGGGG